MPKVKISEYSATANSNTDVASINIDEGCAPSGINNAIRAIMGHLKDFQSGTSNDPFTVGSSGSLTLSYGTANGVAYLNGSKVLTTGSALVFDGTNVGIGTSSPTAKLTVSGNQSFVEKTAAYLGVDVATSAGNGGNLTVKAGAGNGAGNTAGTLYLGAGRGNASASNGSIVFGIAQATNAVGLDSTLMTLDASGNLGIANTSMGQKLAVNGGIQTNGSAALGVGFGGGAVLSFESPVTRMYFGDGTGYSLVFSKRGSSTTTDLMTLTDSGNLGIGTTSPATKLHISTDGTYDPLRLQSTQSGYARSWTIGPNVGANGFFVIRDSTAGENRLAIDSSGNLLVGTTGTGGLSTGRFRIEAASGADAIRVRHPDASGGTSATMMLFISTADAAVGSITSNGTSTAYNTSSDYRLKNTIAPMTGALVKLAQLKPVTYKWNADGSDGEGFIAHELAEVVPQCVTGEKDAVDADGKPVYQGIDTSFLVATLTAAIQELKAEFDAYKASHP